MGATYSTKVCLAMKSGGYCAFEDCHVKLTVNGKESKSVIIGEAAHIYGENETAARYKAEMSEQERNAESNLIYLCPNCHTKIDKQEFDYSVDYLLTLKANHEKWVENRLSSAMDDFSFAELKIATKAIASGKMSDSMNFHVIPPQDKINKNNLSGDVASYLAMGLSKSGEVSQFLSLMSQADDGFAERLQEGFKSKYDELKKSYDGDTLFFEMMSYVLDWNNDFKVKSAGLALLSHMFNICEVFEK